RQRELRPEGGDQVGELVEGPRVAIAQGGDLPDVVQVEAGGGEGPGRGARERELPHPRLGGGAVEALAAEERGELGGAARGARHLGREGARRLAGEEGRERVAGAGLRRLAERGLDAGGGLADGGGGRGYQRCLVARGPAAGGGEDDRRPERPE